MMWFKTDALIRRNPKFRKLLRRSRDAALLWWLAGTECGLVGSDGAISVDMVEDIAHDLGLDEDEWRAVVAILVDVGSWHDRRSVRKCDSCLAASSKMERDGWLMHDFWDFNPVEDQTLIPIEKLRWKRKEALTKDRVLCEAIQKRDGDHCRYCGCQVNWRDRSSDRGATYDHLDPNLFEPNFGNTMDNVVVACRGCNGQKRDRTPAEWLADGGLALRPAPDRNLPQSGLGRDPVATRSRPAQGSPRGRSRERGARETERAGSGATPDPVATSSDDDPQNETTETGDDHA